MPEKRNYLLGYGERLTVPVEITGGGGRKKPPYTFEEARSQDQAQKAKPGPRARGA